MDNEDKALLLDSLGGIVRDQRHRLADALTEFGWHELLAENPGSAVAILMELTGEHLADHAMLDAVALRATGHQDESDTAVVYPLPAAPGPTNTLEDSQCVVLRGLVCARPMPPTRVVVPALDEERIVIATVPWQGEWPQEGTGIDPDGGLAPLNGVLPVEPADLVTGTAAADVWSGLRMGVHRALAHHLVGVGSAMLDLAVDHVRSRTQFGRPLASFQAVKHRLADVRLWQECARLAADAAWESAGTGDEHTAAAVAKSTANRFTRLAREHCQQVLGGMGFTWEHDLHRYVRRALVVEPWFGSTPQLRTQLGRTIQAQGGPPRLAPL